MIQDQNIFATTLITSCVLLTTLAYFNYKNKLIFFEKYHIKTPQSTIIFGNLHSFLLRNPTLQRIQWAKSYGRIYGFFWNYEPRLMIGDAEILQQICIKDFDIFVNHKLSIYSNKYQDQFLTFLKDDQWRRVRALMTPTFTGSKVRAMHKLLVKCSEDLELTCDEMLINSSDAIINVKELFNLYSMDAITSCCFGLKLCRQQQQQQQQLISSDAKNTTNDTFTRDDFVRDAMLINQLSKWRILVSTFSPEWLIRLLKFQVYPDYLYEPIAQRTAKIIRSRRLSPLKINDYLQSLLDSRISDNDINEIAIGTVDKSITDHRSDSRVGKQLLSLNDNEILCGAILFLLVGMDQREICFPLQSIVLHSIRKFNKSYMMKCIQ